MSSFAHKSWIIYSKVKMDYFSRQKKWVIFTSSRRTYLHPPSQQANPSVWGILARTTSTSQTIRPPEHNRQHQTMAFDILYTQSVLDRVCPLPRTSSQTKKRVLPFFVRVRESMVLTQSAGDGKLLQEQIGSCPTSASHTEAAKAAGLKEDRGRPQVGWGQAWVIKCGELGGQRL